MKVYCVQLNVQWENKTANFNRVEELLRGVFPARYSLVLLPEMFASGFTMNLEAAADSDKRETEAFLCYLAKEFEIYVLGGLVSKTTNGRGHNQAVVFSPAGKRIATYTKIQPFTLGGEATSYSAGHELVTFQWEGITVAPYICYDLRFPEVVRPSALNGVQLLTFIASWPEKRIQHWMKLLQARAIENQCYVAGANRIGDDPFHHHPGRSLIVDYMGEVIADAGEKETVINATLNTDHLAEYRKGLPFLQDIRPDFLTSDSMKF